MKAVYDAATSAAAQQASELGQQANKMHYDILVKTPILVFPRDVASPDAIIANLGEMSVNNSFSSEGDVTLTHIDAALRKIRLSSVSKNGEDNSELQMLKNVDLAFDLTMAEGLNHAQDKDTRPETDVRPSLEIGCFSHRTD